MFAILRKICYSPEDGILRASVVSMLRAWDEEVALSMANQLAGDPDRDVAFFASTAVRCYVCINLWSIS